MPGFWSHCWAGSGSSQTAMCRGGWLLQAGQSWLLPLDRPALLHLAPFSWSTTRSMCGVNVHCGCLWNRENILRYKQLPLRGLRGPSPMLCWMAHNPDLSLRGIPAVSIPNNSSNENPVSRCEMGWQHAGCAEVPWKEDTGSDICREVCLLHYLAFWVHTVWSPSYQSPGSTECLW